MPANVTFRDRAPQPRALESSLAYQLPLVGEWTRPVMWIKADLKRKFTDEQLALLIDLGFRTAINCGIDCSDILVRSGFHRTTMVSGRCISDRCHVSYAFKYPRTSSDKYIAAHGYTLEEWDPFLLDSSHDEPKLDETRNCNGNMIWPKDTLRLADDLCSPDMEIVRTRMIKRVRTKSRKNKRCIFWNRRDPRDVKAQFPGQSGCIKVA